MPAVWIVVVAVAAIGCVGGYFVRRLRRPAEEEVFHHNCPKCKRRFRFRARQSGLPAECPRCRERFTYPLVQGK